MPSPTSFAMATAKVKGSCWKSSAALCCHGLNWKQPKVVFESLLVEVLNRFLGPYIKNLDASQLKVGIWGGGQYLEAV